MAQCAMCGMNADPAKCPDCKDDMQCTDTCTCQSCGKVTKPNEVLCENCAKAAM